MTSHTTVRSIRPRLSLGKRLHSADASALGVLIPAPSASVNPTDTNTRNLYAEIFFAGILGSVLTFNAPFVTRLGASKEVVALLTALPFLVTAIFSIPAAQFMKTRVHYKAWLLGMLMTFRAGHLMIAVIPWLLPQDLVMSANFIIAWIILLTLPLTLFDNAWRALLGELIPEDRRAYVFSRRSIIASLTVAVGTMVVGWVLNAAHNQFPYNYQAMYILGFIASLGSHFYLSRLKIPERPVQTAEQIAAPKRKLTLTMPMKRMLWNSGIYQFGVTFYAGVGTIQFVKYLHATDDWIGFITSVGFVGGIIGFVFWERMLRKHDFGWAIRRATLYTWCFPFVLAYVPNLPLIALGNFVVNLMHPGAELSSSNIILQLTSKEDREAFIARYMTVISIASLTAPLIGVWLADHFAFGVSGVIFLSGVFRLLGGVLFNIYAVESRPALPTPSAKSLQSTPQYSTSGD